MFAMIAALLFSFAAIFAVGVIVLMLVTYHDKMVAALLFQPIPKDAPVIVEARRGVRS